MKWKPGELRRIADKDDLHISPFRKDGVTYGTPTWIVAAFQTIPSEVLMPVFKARGKVAKPSVLYCGDDLHSKATMKDLVKALTKEKQNADTDVRQDRPRGVGSRVRLHGHQPELWTTEQP